MNNFFHILGHRDGKECVKYLLENGATLTARTKVGSSAVHYAAHTGSVEVMTFLIEKGVPLLNRKNQNLGIGSIDLLKKHTIKKELSLKNKYSI